MILSDPRAAMRLSDYGIQIPVLDSRVTKTLRYLDERGLLSNGVIDSRITEKVGREDLKRVNDAGFIDRLYSPALNDEILSAYELIDHEGKPFRYDPECAICSFRELFDTIMLHVAGTIQTCKKALRTGFCYFLGGGMHHGHFDHGSGFCLINDIVVAAKRLIAEKEVERLWIIDIDAHKGDGTAALAHNDPAMLTLSIHMGDSWPLDPETIAAAGPDNPALIPSDVDIPIAKHENECYLERLGEGLIALKELADATEKHKKPADLAIVVDGSDPYEKDELPSTESLKLSLPTMLQRDMMVLSFLQSHNIPSAWLMAGGYGRYSWEVYAQFLEAVLEGRMD